jgi:excisionase family DNA binding protein
MATVTTLPNLLDITQLAEHLGTSQRHIRRLIADRRIPYVKVGGRIRFDPHEIRSWIDEARRPVGGGMANERP